MKKRQLLSLIVLLIFLVGSLGVFAAPLLKPGSGAASSSPSAKVGKAGGIWEGERSEEER